MSYTVINTFYLETANLIFTPSFLQLQPPRSYPSPLAGTNGQFGWIVKGGGPADSAQTLRENCFRYQPSKTHKPKRGFPGIFNSAGFPRNVRNGWEWWVKRWLGRGCWTKQEAFPHLLLVVLPSIDTFAFSPHHPLWFGIHADFEGR